MEENEYNHNVQVKHILSKYLLKKMLTTDTCGGNVKIDVKSILNLSFYT